MKKIKHFIAIASLLIIVNNSYSQIGIGTTAPDGALDVTSTSDGLLIPRVALTISTSALPLTAPTVSELVYNTATIADVTPGYYYWNGTIWVRLASGTATNDWSITGNTGIVDGTNFIGTAAATNVDVAFRRNNFAAGKIGLTSTSFGVGALTAGAASNSSAFGTNALSINTGANNVAVGNGSLASNTSGSNNVAVGTGTLAANLTGIQNTGVGHNALLSNTGNASTAVGQDALRTNTTGINGTAVGFEALRGNLTGSNLTAVGFQALRNNTASNNTGVGFQALSLNTLGSSNTAVGHLASYTNSSGNNNTSLGLAALQLNTIGSDNTALGHSVLGRVIGSRNTSIGFESAFASGTFSNTTAVGWHALFSNTVNESTAVGYQALNNNATGIGNTGVGFSVLNNNATGANNTALGNQAGFGITLSNNTLIGYTAGQFSTGANNTAVGSNALKANGASANSVAIGFNALTANTAASNTAVGFSALSTNVTGTGNVAIGNQAGSLETGSNKLYVSNANTTATTSLIYGEFAPSRILRTNGTFQIGDPAGTGYVFPTARGTVNQILQTDGVGVMSWVNPSALSVTETDPQVSSATNNTIPKWNGTTLVDGIVTDNGTTVSVAGTTSTTNLQMTTGATANYILQSDATGNGTWVNPTTLSITETDPQVSTATNNTIPKWNGTTLVDGIMTDNGTTVAVAGTTSTTNLQMTAGAAANFVLQSDATGNASWVNANTLTITETDPQVSSATNNTIPKWNGTTLVDGLITDNGTSVGIGTAAPDGALDITSTSDGLLIPRVALTISTSALPLTAPTVSELVYNTATIADVTPGYYYWNGTIWVRLASGTATNDWSITGNTGIVDGTNFIGTAAATNVDVAFRRNNFAAGKIGLTSTSFGVGALTAGAASNSSAFGTNALSINTGANNVAVGNGSLASNTSGSNNVAVGTGTLAANLTGIQNTGVGHNALLSNTGNASTAVGQDALRTNTTGINGTAVGFEALRGNLTGSNLTAVGFQALRNNTASNNTGVGFQALSLNTLGSSNTAVGHLASYTNSSGNNNTSLGLAALQLNTIGSDNTALGHSVLGRVIGSRNTSIGFESAFASGTFSNTTAVGWHALFSNTVNESTAVGYQALNNNATGIGNTGVGFSVLNNNATGANNTALGNQAGFGITLSNNTLIGYTAGQFSTGANNTAVGSNALKANGASANSVAIGFNALTANTAASNTAVGFSALSTNVTGTGNVAIGNQAGSLETGSNKLYVSNANTTATTSLIYGEFAPSRILRTNGTFQIGDPAGTGYVFPTARGTVNQILQTDGVGVMSWVNPSALSVTETDPQVSSATNNTIPKWNGTTLVDGIVTDNGTTVSVAGTTSTTNLQMTTGATANYILQSDATGNGTWVNPTTLSITETDPQVSTATNNTIPKWNGTTLVDGIMTDNGTTVAVAGTTSTTNLQMTAGAAANFVLQSDATGNASWVNANTLTITETDPQVSSATNNTIPKWNGTTLVDGLITDNGTTVGIGTASALGALDVSSTTDGIVIPRVALTITTSALPLTLPTTSELVYNTATIADVTPGYYYWNGTSWLRIATGANAWLTTGNTGIVDGTNYIGTAAATNVDVAFRRNNAAAGKIGTTSTSFGVGALTAGAATNSTAIGNNALSVSTGSNNVAVGQNALLNSASTAQWNTAVGTSALRGINNAASQNNTAIGFEAMTGAGNISNTTAIGYHALFQNTAGNSTAVGYNALQGQIGGGTNNTGFGFSALNNNTLGDNNTAVGGEAGFNALGSGNTLIGYFAGRNASNATGASTFVGFQAGQGTTGANNTALGNNALAATGASGNSVAVGNSALVANTATNNTAIGFNSLVTNITGTGNVAIGNQAGALELGSNKLYVSNSNTSATTSLIYGEFSPALILRTNGTLQIGDPAGVNGYALPILRGTANQILRTDGVGGTSWVSTSTTESDPQVSSATINSIPKWNGTALVDGVVTDDGTNVGIGIAPSVGNKLDVAGNTKTTNFQMTTGATATYFLQSDATGNGSWAPIPVNTVKPFVSTGAAIGIYSVSLTEYTVRIFNSVSEVTLPNATTNTGKVYILIGSNGITSKILSTLGGIVYDDVTNTTIITIAGGERLMVQSDGTDWLVIGR